MTKEQALYSFWNSFGMQAYEENSVPTDDEEKPKFPYITYQVVIDSFDNQVQLTASLWDRDKNGYSALLENSKKAEEISQRIGRGGVFIDCDGGKIWLERGTPFAQNMGDTTDNLIKRKYLNLSAEFLTAD
jgi:hypothetical protein